MERDLMVQRKTATKYLTMMVDAGILTHKKVGRENYYLNHELVTLFLNQDNAIRNKENSIQSITDHLLKSWLDVPLNGYISSKRVPKNAKMGTYHQNVYPKTPKWVHIIRTVSSKKFWKFWWPKDKKAIIRNNILLRRGRTSSNTPLISGSRVRVSRAHITGILHFLLSQPSHKGIVSS